MRTESEVAAMQCPVCRVPLAMSDRQGIEIDYCPRYSQHGGQAHSGYGHGYGKPHKRKKSFFEEIFD